MLHFTLGPARSVDPRVDALGRSQAGYSDEMSPAELHEANRGCWILGARADNEQYALFSYGGIVRQAMAIDRIVPAGSRRALEGPILGPDHPVSDAFVGQEAPVRTRNPVAYFDARVGRRACACGCGEELTRGLFVSGHDQRAIHDRIARVGTVRDFIDWFDATWQGRAS